MAYKKKEDANGFRYQVLGGLCAQRREQEGLTLRDVAKLTGIAPTTIMRMEQGRRANAENVIALSEWLNVPIETATEPITADVPRAVSAILYKDPKLASDQRKDLIKIFRTLYRLMASGDRCLKT